MKKLVILVLLLKALSYAQTPVTLTGTITDSSNNVATGGYVEFDLQPANPSTNYKAGGFTIAPQVSRCAINATGQLVNYITGTGTCFVWGNDVITPSNTTYNVIIAPLNSTTGQTQVTGTWQNALITGSSQNIAGLPLTQPQPVIGTIINASPLVTQTVVPDLPNVRTLGTPNNPYAAIYANNISGGVLNLNSPPPIGAVTPNTINGTTFNAVVYAQVGETVAHAVSRLPVGGGVVVLANGTYASGGLDCTTANVTLQGSGIPNLNSLTAPTALTGGTIIQGPVQGHQGCDHFIIRDLGVDTGPTWINANNGGVPTEGIAVYNNGQTVGAPQVQFPVVQNVIVLGYSLSAASHALLLENVNGAAVINVNLVLDQHGLVIKGTNVNVVGVYSSGHSIDSVLAKSDTYAVSSGINFTDVNITSLASVGDTAGMFLQAAGVALLHVTVNGGNISNVSNWGILLSGASPTILVSGVTIQGVNFDWNGTPSAGIDCVQYQSNVANFVVANINCFNYGSGIIPNASTSTMQNINVSNSNFINLVGNGIEMYGRSTVSNNTLVSIGGNGVQSDNGSTTVASNQLASIVGTGYSNSGGTILFPSYAAALVTTAAGSDNVSISGVVSTSHCSLTATNASAATNIATTYISSKTGNQITVTHTATANMNYDIICTPN